MLSKPQYPVAKFLALCAVVLLPLMLFIACGGSESSSPPATEPPAGTQAAAPEATAVSEPTEATDTDATEEPTSAPIKVVAAPTPEATEAPDTPVPPATPPATEAAESTETPTAPPSTEPPDAEPATEPVAAAEPCEGNRGGAVGDCAPELAGTQEWINSEPFTMESQLGKVVLIDFWTYSCINCIRTLPFLQTWHERYADEGLVILGVHTPEFEFEKVYDNVVEHSEEMGVSWPVVQDNEFTVWRSYANRFWPAKYLIDKDGVIRYRHFGEGRYPETEEAIRQLLAETGAETDALALPLPEDQQVDSTYRTEASLRRTPELFAGWRFTNLGERVGIGQKPIYKEAAQVSYRRANQSSEVADFETPTQVVVDNMYFQGPWAIGPESARHARETDSYDEDFILLAYSSRSVNAVLTSDSGEPYKVLVKINNQFLTEENKGEDVVIDENGVSYVMVTSPKAYYLVEHPSWQENQYLQLFSTSDDFGLFSFTFGTYEDGF